MVNEVLRVFLFFIPPPTVYDMMVFLVWRYYRLTNFSTTLGLISCEHMLDPFISCMMFIFGLLCWFGVMLFFILIRRWLQDSMKVVSLRSD